MLRERKGKILIKTYSKRPKLFSKTSKLIPKRSKLISEKQKLIYESQKLISKSQKLISKLPKLIFKSSKLISAGFHLSGLDWISHKKSLNKNFPHTSSFVPSILVCPFGWANVQKQAKGKWHVPGTGVLPVFPLGLKVSIAERTWSVWSSLSSPPPLATARFWLLAAVQHLCPIRAGLSGPACVHVGTASPTKTTLGAMLACTHPQGALGHIDCISVYRVYCQ